MKIGYLGPKGTYCYEACNQYIKEKDTEKIAYKTITDELIAVQKRQIDYAIVPIENSIYGSVLETVDMLIENNDLKINGEIVLNISHYLFANKKYKKEEIKEIYSHPQALAQCRNYLRAEFPNCTLTETTSTAFGAKQALEKDNTACIANKACMEEYNLQELDHDIQDQKHNQTRFIIVGREYINKNQNKISMVFSTSNEPGELFRALAIFDILKINLTKIESRPAKTKLGEYVFWVDFEGEYEDKKTKQLIEIMKDMCSYTQILGGY